MVANKDLSYVELYDIVKDPYEKSDLKEQQPEVVEQLLKKVKVWQGELPAEPTGDVFSELRKK
jgi:hypothetical protein